MLMIMLGEKLTVLKDFQSLGMEIQWNHLKKVLILIPIVENKGLKILLKILNLYKLYNL